VRLGGPTEVARVLSVSRERVYALARGAGRLPHARPFPPPLAVLARGPVWDFDEVARGAGLAAAAVDAEA